MPYCPFSAHNIPPFPPPPPLHPPNPPPPPHSDSWKQKFIRFVLLLFSLPTAPFPFTPSPQPPPPTPHCRNRICRNHSKARYNLLLAAHNAPLPLSPPFLNRTRCPADELIILEILFLLLIPPFYEQPRFYGAVGLTPACYTPPSAYGGRTSGVGWYILERNRMSLFSPFFFFFWWWWWGGGLFCDYLWFVLTTSSHL